VTKIKEKEKNFVIASEEEREGEGVCVVVLNAPVRGPLECAEAVRAMGTVAAAEEKEVVAGAESMFDVDEKLALPWMRVKGLRGRVLQATRYFAVVDPRRQ